ncbi:MAG: hypothetical protein ABI824_18810, partial [Acidobacteriota bacterium]
MKATCLGPLFLLLGTSVSIAQESRRDWSPLLREQMGVSAAQIAAAAQNGTVLSRVFPEKEKKQIGAAGVVRVRVPLKFALNQIEDIEAFKTGSAVLQVGKFSSIPVDDDLRSLVLAPADVKSLPGCRPGACDLKLTAEMLREIQSEINGRRT